MKCLEKDRSRRYETALALAMDVQRLSEQRAGGSGPAVGAVSLPQVRPPEQGGAAHGLGRRGGAARGDRGGYLAGGRCNPRIGGAGRRGIRTKGERDRGARPETQAVLDFVQNKVFAAAGPKGKEGGLGREVTLRGAVEAALPFVENSFANEPLIEARLRMTLGRSFSVSRGAQERAEQFQKARAALHPAPRPGRSRHADEHEQHGRRYLETSAGTPRP